MGAMIVTVTLNPAIDQTLVLDHMAVGEANRVVESRMDPGGKGINVSRTLRELGTGSVATGFAPGGLGRYIEHELERLGILVDFVHSTGETRTNITLIDPGKQSTTTVHEKGPVTDTRYVEMLRARIRKYMRPGVWLVIAGSIPPPLDACLYAELIEEANAAGATTVLDADHDGLRCGIDAQPHFVKVNRHELEHWVGHSLDTEDEVVAAAEAMHATGVRWVLVTRSQHPSIGVDAEGVWRAMPPTVDLVRSTVGAGDATLAAAIQVLSRGGTFAHSLQHAMAAGSACTLSPGTMLCSAENVDEFEDCVDVQRIRVYEPAGV